MFRRWFIWCMALAVLSGNIAACAEQSSEKGTTKSKSELIAAEYGYTVVEDVDPSQCAVKDLEFVPFLKEGESYINNKEMRQRAVNLKANLGLADAKRLLDNHAEIPAEFQGKYLVFPGTLSRGSDGDLRVACLYWGGGCWHLYFRWLDDDFYGINRLVRCK